jgi:hypothetical protein
MKISIKELRPNPFRDLARYPIHREKVEALKASIRSTGFWDNVLARKAEDNGHFEIAYGHHRLQALLELIKEEVFPAGYELEIPVRKLDDATMIRIMANENLEEYRVTADIIDETVRVTREYIMRSGKTPLAEISASDISQFLGGAWHEDKVSVSMQRLALFDRGTLVREQLAGLSHTAAKGIQREVAKVEKTIVRDKLDAMDEDEELTEQDRKRIRSQAQKVAKRVGEVLSEHLRGGGKTTELAEKSLDTQAEQIPEGAPEDERKLSTIDYAARSLNAREFRRKVELLLKYKEYMSPGAKHELAGTLRETAAWSKQMLATLE